MDGAQIDEAVQALRGQMVALVDGWIDGLRGCLQERHAERCRWAGEIEAIEADNEALSRDLQRLVQLVEALRGDVVGDK